MIAEAHKTKLFYWITGLYIALCATAFYLGLSYLLFVPFALFFLLLVFFAIDKLFLMVVAFTPLAINIRDSSLGVSLPTEPILVILMMVFFFKLLRQGFDKKIFLHVISVAILLNLFWILFTSMTSDIRMVSFKFFTARLWFVTVCFFWATQFFRNFANVKRFVWCYSISLLIVIFYVFTKHLIYGFKEQVAHWASTPFFNDHTAYAAAIAMFIPPMISFTFMPTYKARYRLAAMISVLLLLAATVLSYTRAAWISLAVALGIQLVLMMKLKLRFLLITASCIVLVALPFRTQIIMKLQENHQDSSTDYTSHLKSITNISTDASNLERINRWKSALRMFQLRPVLGWGPGTYMFEYAPFQMSKEKTIISTNVGNGGNAHSEYIGPLAESGVLGMLTFVFILVAVTYRSLLLITTTNNREIRLIVSGLYLGLVTYFVHGTLNNFLDSDKASVPFWGFIAIITAIDIYHRDHLELAAADQ